MKTIRKLNKQASYKAVIFFSLMSFVVLSALGQDFVNPEPGKSDSLKNEWWYPILQKHGLELKNYYVYRSTYIIGDQKKLNDSIEAYENAVVLISGGIYFVIIEKCDSVYYNKNTKIFILRNGLETMYKQDFSLINPFRIYDVALYKSDFLHNTSLSSVCRSKSEIRKEINEFFEENIKAVERLDFDFLENTINDKYQAGFIDNGKYYTSSSSLLTVYRSKIKEIKAQQIKILDKKTTILTDWSVLLTANGEFTSTTQSGAINKGTFAWTIIYEMIDNKWKIIHLNMSNQ